MLSLRSPRWSKLRWHIDALPPPPVLIARWKAAIGTRREQSAYAPLFEQYSHQLTILSCAYAVVPHVVSALRRVSPERRLEYLCDVAWVETRRFSGAARQRALEAEIAAIEERVQDEALSKHFRTVLPERYPLLPPDLADDYLGAIRKAKAMTVALLDRSWSPENFSRLLGALTAFTAPKEKKLAQALLMPDSTMIEVDDDEASISTLLSTRR